MDYLTEKFFASFLYGSLPVVWGAPNVHEYEPGPNSFVNALDFESPLALAEYLVFLDKNDDEYLKFHHWRKLGPSQTFVRLGNFNFAQPGNTSWMCRTCMFYYHHHCSHSAPRSHSSTD